MVSEYKFTYVMLYDSKPDNKHRSTCLNALYLDKTDLMQIHKTYCDNYITKFSVSINTERIKNTISFVSCEINYKNRSFLSL